MAKNNAINLEFTLGATDNAIVRTDGTGNDAIQAGSGAALDDNGRFNTPVGANGGYYFGDGDSGFKESADDSIVLESGGSDVFTADSSQNITLESTGALTLNVGTQLERPGAPVNGMIRYETDTPTVEAYIGGVWTDLIGSGTIGGSTGATDNAVLRANGVGGSTLQNSGIIIDDSDNLSGMLSMEVAGIAAGYTDSEWVFAQGSGQTAGLASATLATISLPTNTMVAVRASITGFDSTYAYGLVADIYYGARRVAGGAIEISDPLISQLSDFPTPFIISGPSVSGNDVLITGQGFTGYTVNWVCSYSYHFTKTNA